MVVLFIVVIRAGRMGFKSAKHWFLEGFGTVAAITVTPETAAMYIVRPMASETLFR
jgi:hypothetical protein